MSCDMVVTYDDATNSEFKNVEFLHLRDDRIIKIYDGKVTTSLNFDKVVGYSVRKLDE